MAEPVVTKEKTLYERVPGWVVVALFVVAGGLGALAFALRDSSPATGTEREARSACHQFVERRLKSPGSAEFGGEAVAGPGPIWKVTGSVDSQNSFGTKVRNRYVCEADYADGKNWKLVDLQMSGN